jgi:hypothetical protein
MDQQHDNIGGEEWAADFTLLTYGAHADGMRKQDDTFAPLLRNVSTFLLNMAGKADDVGVEARSLARRLEK